MDPQRVEPHRSAGAIIVAIGVALLCAVVIGALVWGAWRSEDGAAVDELPTVAEVVAAQAHRHGIDLPELDDEDRARLSAAPSAVSTLDSFDQVLVQLLAVRDAAGVNEAIDILGEVAAADGSVATQCARLYEALTADSATRRSLTEVCPSS